MPPKVLVTAFFALALALALAVVLSHIYFLLLSLFLQLARMTSMVFA